MHGDADAEQRDRRRDLQQSQRRRLHQNEQDRRQQQDAHRQPLDPDQLPHQLDAPGKGAFAARMLDRMRDLVGCDRDGCDRAAMVVLRQKPDRAALGIVMVAVVGHLDLDVGKLCFVEQMAGQLGAGAGQVRAVDAVLAQHVPDPPLRAEHQRDQQERTKGNDDGHVTAPIALRLRV